MSFIKRASIKNMPVEALNVPTGPEWEIFNTDRIKVASIDKTKSIDLGGFNLEAALDEQPNHLFVKAFAIKENEVNDNGDAFSPAELRRAAHTFIGCPVFVNHQNDDVEKARGKVVHAWYDEDAGGIYVINMVDKEAYPRLARGIEEKFISGTSMGAQVGYSCCSICHNKASTKDQFCSHIKERKNKKFSGEHDCKFHKSSEKPEGNCPVHKPKCGCKKGESMEHQYKDAQIFEWNYDIKFIEDSFVVNPACHDCLVCDILNVPKIEAKLAASVEKLKKISAQIEESANSGKIEKTAGMKEVTSLNDAMNLIEAVARSMMAQKQVVSMEYVSDLVEQLSKLQETTDELIEMGYSQLPSPPQNEMMFGNSSPASPMAGGGAQQVQNPNAMLGGQQQSQMSQSAPSYGNPQTAPSGNGIATVTKPAFSNEKKEFSKLASNLYESAKSIYSGIKLAESIVSNTIRSSSVLNISDSYAASSGENKVVVAKTETGDIHVAEFNGAGLVRLSSISTFDSDIQKLLVEQPGEAAKKILNLRSGSKESSATMANEKTAAGQGVSQEQTEVITQKQLESKIQLHPRQNEYYETTTEGKEQLAGKERSNDTTSESPQVRRGTYDTITEEQLASIKDAHMTRWNDFPEVITEKQWDEMSRSVDGALPEDYTEQITQAQLLSLRKDHRWEDPEVITENQLAEQKGTMPSASETARWKAASTDVNALIKAAAFAVTDAIANYGLSPRDIASAISVMTSSPQSQMKSAYLTLINALPLKKAHRSEEVARRRYFEGKVASSKSVNSVDAMLSAMADNIGYLKAENFVDAVRRVVANKAVLAKAEADAMEKIASRNDVSDVADFESVFNNALANFGRHKVAGSIKDDLGISNLGAESQSSFIAKAYAFAKSKVNGKTILSSVDVDDKAGVFEIELKDVSASTKEDIEAFAAAEKDGFKSAGRGNMANFGDKKANPFGKKNEDKSDEDKSDNSKEEKESCNSCTASTRTASRSELVKQAQMMGGQMPSGMGDGGGQGASLPPAPGGAGAGGPGVQSFGQDPMGEDPMGGDDLEGDSQAMPPGSICPVCGVEDVEVVAGKGKCNNCNSEFTFKVSIEVTKWAELTGGEEGEPGAEDPLAPKGEGEGVALPESGGMEESLPVAASTRIKPEALKKMAQTKVQFGRVSPYIGGQRTTYLGMSEDGANEFLCHATGYKYLVRTAQKEDKIYAQWEWQDHTVEPCGACRRNKKAFAQALTALGETEASFHKMNRKARGAAILKMAKNGSLKTIKTANKSGSALDEYKKVLAFVPADKFPSETCREILSRTYGEDAICLSGPDEGKNLADAVCKRLSTASIYSDGLAIKIAKLWSAKDGCVNCLEDYIRAGYSADDSALVCLSLKKKYAQAVELLADDLGDLGGMDGGDPAGMDSTPPPADPMFGDDMSMDGAADPFAAGAEQEGFVNVEIPLSVLEQLDSALDQALGQDPGMEAHHQPGAMPEGTAEVAVPVETVEQIDQVVDPALDAAVGVDQAMDGVTEEVAPEGEAADAAPADDAVPAEEESSPFDGGSEESSDSSESADSPSDSAPSEESSDETVFEEETKDEGSEDKNDDDGEEKKNPFTESSAKNSGQKKESADSNSTNVVTASTSSGNNKMDNLEFLNRSRIAGTGKVTNLDLSGVISVLKKKADSGLTQKNVQDDSDTKPYGGDGGSAMGHEEGFKAAEPDVPSKGSGATMGKESTDLMPTDNTEIPAGGGEMGHEKEQGYTAEKGHEFTGGVNGAGSSKAASRSHQGMTTKKMSNDLASRLVSIASDKKVNAPKPTSEDSSIGKVQENKDHSDTPEKMQIKPREEGDGPDVPEKGSGAFMGHEKESIGEVPKSPQNLPSIPSGGGKTDKDKNEKNNPEKQEDIKGTVIAGRDAESLANSRRAAEKLAGKMIEAGKISVDQISTKIAEFSRYQVETIADIEKALFGAHAKKGLDTVAQGVSTPLVINASKNARQDPAVELKGKLQSLFTLDKRNILANDDPNAQMNVFKK